MNLSPSHSTPSLQGSSAPVQTPDGEIDFGAIWRLVVKRRRLIAATVLASFAMAVLFTLVAPPVYLSMATLEALPARTQGKDEDVFGKVLVGGSINVLTVEDMDTTTAKLLRYDFLARVAANPAVQEAMKPTFKGTISSSGAGGKGNTLEQLIIGYLQGNIKVSHVLKTRLIDVTASHRDPKVATLLADTFVRSVIDDGLSSRAAFAGGKIEDLEADFRELSTRMEESQRRLALYLRSDELRTALIKTRNEVKTLAGRYKEKHPKMMEAMEVLRKQEEALIAELEILRNHPLEEPYWTEALSQVPSGGSIEIHRAENLLTGRYQALVTDQKAMSAIHGGLSVRVNELRIANHNPDLELKISQSAVSAEAFPIKLVALAASGILGPGLGIALAYLLAIIRPRVEDSIGWKSATSLPLLGLVGDFADSGSTSSKGTEARSLRDQVRNLRSRLIASSPAHPISFLVTSPLSGEGKTTLATSLARSLAQTHPDEVVLIDLDLQRPSVHEAFSLSNDLGVSEVLLGRSSLDDALARAGGLMVLTAGSTSSDALDHLGSSALAALIPELKQKFRYVIVDSPPVLLTADSLLFAPLCDEVLLVVNARSTPTPAIRQAEEELRSANARIRGGILTQIPVHHSTHSLPSYQYLAKACSVLIRRRPSTEISR